MISDYKPTNILVYDNPAAMVSDFPKPIIHYENDGAILLKNCGFEFDEAFITHLSLPLKWAKIGTANFITSTPIILKDGEFIRTHNPLCQLIRDDRLLLKVYSEFLTLELNFKLLVADVFHYYKNIHWNNCTFRFTPLRNQTVHLDNYSNGYYMPPKDRLPKIKLFLNVDAEPRVWNIGPRLRDVLKFSREYLDPTLPPCINMLNAHIVKSGAFDNCPLTKLEIPPRGVVFANGMTVVHQVIYGNRMVGLEGHMPAESLYSSTGSEWDNFINWINEAGYSLASIPEIAT